MKWKLMGRYLFSIIIIIFIVIFVNTLILISIVNQQQIRGIEDVSSSSAESFTRGFSHYMMLDKEEPIISQEGMQALEEHDAWIQILDDNGHVLSSYRAPDSASIHYTVMEIVHKYKYMDDEFNTYFLGKYEGFSYIIGIPHSKEQRVVFTLNVSSMLSLASKFFLAIIIIDLLVAALIGLLFSSILIKPVDAIIERITQLKHYNFKTQQPKRPGIYKTVFSNLNDVSETLMKHEQERFKLENMRNEWISNVSHDLKTPLASIRGYAELLCEREVPANERLEYSEIIERQSIYMKDLLDDFNLTMRLRNQQIMLQLQETPIESFVREIIIDLLNDPQFKDRDISFTHEAPEFSISMDQHLMRRALTNFIYNALIHNEVNVGISIIVTYDFISIEDDGKGIAKEDQNQIFDRYYRGGNTKNCQGSGLGMAIARDIIEAHGMTVELASQIGKGTIIKIWF